MYILLALIAAAVLGIAVHFSVPRRSERGVILTPALCVATAAVVYSALTWLQWGEGNVWLWVVTLGAAVAVSVAVTAAVGIARARRDAAERERLRIA